MIRLAARLAISGGRESVVRLVLTALGVAIGSTLLLLAAAGDPAIRAHQHHTAWQFTTDQANRGASGDPLLWRLARESVDGREMTVLRVAATGPTSPAPLGLDRVPVPGEVHVSPPLARLAEELPADQLADRFPSTPAGTIDRRYLAGPDDLVAVVGVPVEQLRGQPDTLEVHQVRTAPATYQFTDFLRLVLGIGAVGLLMPVVVFVSTSTRLGAARREQRFAALRLAGATPRQVHLVAAVEAGAAAVLGVVVGAVGFVLLRPQAARIEIDGHRSFPSDLRVPPVVVVGILVGIVVLAVVAAMSSLRRLQISPLGVARRSVRSRPTARRLLPLVVGAGGFIVCLGLAARSNGPRMLPPVMVTFALMIYGIVAAGPWLTVLSARAIGRVGRHAGALLAGRRLEDDPGAGFRAVSGLVLAVFVGSVLSGVTPAVLADGGTERAGLVQDSTMVATLPGGTSGAQASGALAAAAAAGAGPGIVLHVDADPDRPLADPAVGRGVTLLASCADLDVLPLDVSCATGATTWVDTTADEIRLEPAPYTEAEVAAMPARLLVVATDGGVVSTDRIRTAIEVAVPGAEPRLGAEQAAEGNRRLTQLTRLANLALALTVVIAGCGLAVAVAGGIIERKRPFALLRLAGMHLAELQRVAMLEAVAPLLLIATATALLGLGTSALIVGIAGGIAWQPPSIGYWLCLAGGLGVALGIVAATLPLLGRTTAPSAVRFE